ncbi:HEPN domain protein [Bacteroidales bacterium Barb6]|nr:HEPN domain protein [Bacteroidales bacterium Barb6]
MTQELNDAAVKALFTYRIQRAKETLLEADSLMRDDFYNAAVNRLYYACYYAVVALLVKNGIPAQTHQGVKQMFGMHFIATGKIDNKYAKFYSRLFNDRMSGDYDDFLTYDAEMLSALRPQSEEFICVVERELYKNLTPNS